MLLSAQTTRKVVVSRKKLKCHPLFLNIFYRKIPGTRKKGGINQAGKEKLRPDLTMIEPIFGQIKDCRKIGSFMVRSIESVSVECNLICATHNLLKLFRSGKLKIA